MRDLGALSSNGMSFSNPSLQGSWIYVKEDGTTDIYKVSAWQRNKQHTAHRTGENLCQLCSTTLVRMRQVKAAMRCHGTAFITGLVAMPTPAVPEAAGGQSGLYTE